MRSASNQDAFLEYTELRDKWYVWFDGERGIKLTSQVLFGQLRRMDSPVTEMKKTNITIMWGENPEFSYVWDAY